MTRPHDPTTLRAGATNSPPTPVCAAPSWLPRRNLFASKVFADSASPRSLIALELSTRAFYRHFESKDQLVAAVFLEMARAEKRRLRRKMADGRDAGRRGGSMDRRTTRPGVRREHQVRSAPTCRSRRNHRCSPPPIWFSPHTPRCSSRSSNNFSAACDHGVFHDIDPVTDAQSIQGVVWASTERQWAAGDCERADVRERALRFCLRGLGVAPGPNASVPAEDTATDQGRIDGPGLRRIESRCHRRQQGYGAGHRRRPWQPREPAWP